LIILKGGKARFHTLLFSKKFPPEPNSAGLMNIVFRHTRRQPRVKEIPMQPFPTDLPPSSRRLRVSRRILAVWVFSCLAVFASGFEAQAAISVTLNTSTLSSPPTDARLEIDLFDGDFVANNQATISGIATDGTLAGSDCSVSCTSSPPTFTLSDTGGLGQFLQDLTLGTFLKFDLAFTNAFDGSDPAAAPDRLAVFLFDPDTNFILVSNNLNLSDATAVQDALLTVDFTGGAGNLIRQASATSPAVGINLIPEPPSWSLLLPWAAWLARRPFGKTPSAQET
jgi:hypothetical protein